MIESVILCEGIHDRAFWKGWLKYLGCADLGGSGPVTDPWKKRVAAGQFAYRSHSGTFIRVQPCGGKSNIPMAVKLRLKQRSTESISRLLVALESDVDAHGPHGNDPLRGVMNIGNIVQEFDSAAVESAEGEFDLDGGATKVQAIRFDIPDAPCDGVPAQQTLERLVCASTVAAYPDRASAVHLWLQRRPNAPDNGPKAHGWSYMAGWNADYELHQLGMPSQHSRDDQLHHISIHIRQPEITTGITVRQLLVIEPQQ
jgi:hypothetical protein